MNAAEKEYCLQVLCGILALVFLILVMRELDKGHKREPMNTPPRVDADYEPGEEQRILDRDKSTVQDTQGIKAN